MSHTVMILPSSPLPTRVKDTLLDLRLGTYGSALDLKLDMHGSSLGLKLGLSCGSSVLKKQLLHPCGWAILM